MQTRASARLRAIAETIDACIGWTGNLFAALVLAVVVLLFAQWPLRVFVGDYHILSNDMGQLAHACVFMVGIALAMRDDAHIRLDVVARKMTGRFRLWVDFLGALGVVLPWAIWLMAQSWPFMQNSVRQLERYPESLSPGYFLFKILLVFAEALIALMAIGWGARAGAGLMLPAADGRAK